MIRKAKKSPIKSIEEGAARDERPEQFKGKVRYKKIRGGIHKHGDGQVVRKGEILYADPESLSPIVLEGFTCLDEEIKQATSGISLGIRDKGNGWYDVINKNTGEKLNDKSLRAKDARQFITGDLEDSIKEEKREEKKEEKEKREDEEPGDVEAIDSNDLEE